MWAAAKTWIAAAIVAVSAMALLLFALSLFLNSLRVAEDAAVEVREPSPPSTADTCTFRVSGTVTDSTGEPIESATLELKGAGPFATADRVAVTNYAGRFLYTESGYSTCYLEDLFPTIRSEGYVPWSRDAAVVNDDALEVVLSAVAMP